MNITAEQYIKNKEIALNRFNAGEEPVFSTGICESITAGYGSVDEYGYFEFPLPVNQRTMKVNV